MSKRCPECGSVNEDSRIYCAFCGELMDPELRLIKNLENQKPVSHTEEPAPRKPRDDDEEYIPPRKVQEQKSSPMPWVILGIIAVAVVAALLLLK